MENHEMEKNETDNETVCFDPKLFVPHRGFHESYGYDILFDDKEWEHHELPLTCNIPIGSECQRLGIQCMILFERNLIIETKDGFAFLTTNNEGSHYLYRPLKRPWRDHARALMQTITSLLNTKEYKSSVKERMSGR